MNTIRRTYKDRKETEKDYYQTNPYMVMALREWMGEADFPQHVSIIDPCCGNKVIGDNLRPYYSNIDEFDKFSDNMEPTDFLTHDFKKHYDITIANPPYSSKYNFIKKALEVSTEVFILLPLNTSNYNLFHRDFEDIPEFVGKLQMAPKMFLDQTTDWNPGGTAQYCWYYWSNKSNTNHSKVWYKDLKVIKERLE